MTRFVVPIECERMRRRFEGDDDVSITQLADEFNRSRGCIHRHVHRCCRHEDSGHEHDLTVDDDECQRLRDAHGSVHEIAANFDRAPETVKIHRRGDCDHGPVADDIPRWINMLAEGLGRVPNESDWESWAKKPYTATKIKSFAAADEWQDVLQLAEFPPLADGTPLPFRSRVYQNQSLCEVMSSAY